MLIKKWTLFFLKKSHDDGVPLRPAKWFSGLMPMIGKACFYTALAAIHLFFPSARADDDDNDQTRLAVTAHFHPKEQVSVFDMDPSAPTRLTQLSTEDGTHLQIRDTVVLGGSSNGGAPRLNLVVILLTHSGLIYASGGMSHSHFYTLLQDHLLKDIVGIAQISDNVVLCLDKFGNIFSKEDRSLAQKVDYHHQGDPEDFVAIATAKRNEVWLLSQTHAHLVSISGQDNDLAAKERESISLAQAHKTNAPPNVKWYDGRQIQAIASNDKVWILTSDKQHFIYADLGLFAPILDWVRTLRAAATPAQLLDIDPVTSDLTALLGSDEVRVSRDGRTVIDKANILSAGHLKDTAFPTGMTTSGVASLVGSPRLQAARSGFEWLRWHKASPNTPPIAASVSELTTERDFTRAINDAVNQSPGKSLYLRNAHLSKDGKLQSLPVSQLVDLINQAPGMLGSYFKDIPKETLLEHGLISRYSSLLVAPVADPSVEISILELVTLLAHAQRQRQQASCDKLLRL